MVLERILVVWGSSWVQKQGSTSMLSCWIYSKDKVLNLTRLLITLGKWLTLSKYYFWWGTFCPTGLRLLCTVLKYKVWSFSKGGVTREFERNAHPLILKPGASETLEISLSNLYQDSDACKSLRTNANYKAHRC